MALQGISWLTRKAIGLATITLTIKEYEEGGVTFVDIEQVGTGGIKGTTEKRHLDGKEGEHKDHIFGHVKGISKFGTISEVTDEFLKTGWLPETLEGEIIMTNVTNQDSGWTAQQVWGFEEVQGERRYCRHAVVEKDGKRVNTRLVYDYQA